jgi:general secretion pathway protein I
MKKTNGFTLIEVLIALAILSIALTAIIKTASQNIRDTLYLEDKTIAHWIGMNIINETRAGLIALPTPPDTLEEETTMLGKEWTWQAQFVQSPNPHIKEIHVTVHRKGESNQLADLSGYTYAK